MAINSSLKVEPEQLLQQASIVDATVNSLNSQLQAMQSALTNTNYWKGTAAELHRNDLASKQKEIAALIQRLRAYPTDIRKIAGNYKQAEQENTNKSKQLPADVLR